MSDRKTDYDVIVVGGGPSGATAAHEIALAGHKVLLLERLLELSPVVARFLPVFWVSSTSLDRS